MKIELPGFREDMLRVEQFLWDFFPPRQDKDPVNEILHAVLDAPGKRIRPQLLLLTGRLGADFSAKRERLCKLAAIVECIHTASLIHDDIVDDSPLRRGQPTIQSRFGKDMAVYTGDLILSRVMTELFEGNFCQAGIRLGETIHAMCCGELKQFDCRYRIDITPESYREAVFGKTVALLASSCWIGGMESGCSAGVLTAVEEYGKHLGYLFQIRDDLLDFLSEEIREGKPTHMDFQEGILTLPVLFALEHPKYQPEIRRLVTAAAKRRLTDEEQEYLEHVVRISGGLNGAIMEMDVHYKSACAALERIPDIEIAAIFRNILQVLLISVPDKFTESPAMAAG